MTAKIIDRGRGPEIQGTRITVYDVVDYWKKGWRHDKIAGLFRLPPDDVQEAVRYIQQHHDEVMADYQRILDRHRNYEYPPEVKEKLRRSSKKFQARLAELRADATTEAEHAGDHGGS
jgi:uncharacterized protein (DUF433 family)